MKTIEAHTFTMRCHSGHDHIRLILENDEQQMFVDGDQTFAKELMEELSHFIDGTDRNRDP